MRFFCRLAIGVSLGLGRFYGFACLSWGSVFLRRLTAYLLLLCTAWKDLLGLSSSGCDVDFVRKICLEWLFLFFGVIFLG